MGKNINVSSFEELAHTSQTLQTLSETYMRIANQLMQQAQTMGAAWEGADNQAFVERITGFTDDLQKMSDKVLQASEIIKNIHDNYVARQDDNIGKVNTLQN